MTTPYDTIRIAGGDTATPRNLAKRLAAIAPWLHSGAAFLDCGCGCGEYVRALRERHAVNAQGVEYLTDKVAQAKADPRVADHVRQGDIERLPFPDGSFDTALLNEVLEHVPDENAALTEIRRVLKPAGVLIIFSPNRWYPFETHGTFLKYKFAPPPIRIPHWMPFIPYIPLTVGQRFITYWARNYWPRELAALAVRNGFVVRERKYFWQTFENISGRQPACLKMLAPLLRALAGLGEKLPLLKKFGVSQMLVLQRADGDHGQ